MANRLGPSVGRAPKLLQGLALALFAAACGDEHAAPPAGDEGPTTGVVAADACATPREGCACDVEGTKVDCGVVQEKTNTYVLCQHGTRACVDGAWGPCGELSDKTVAMSR